MQELVQKMTDKCFAKCTGKSGSRLESKVRPPVYDATDMYIDGTACLSGGRSAGGRHTP